MLNFKQYCEELSTDAPETTDFMVARRKLIADRHKKFMKDQAEKEDKENKSEEDDE